MSSILIAPNAMKGSLDAFLFADAVEAGLLRCGLSDVIKISVADGGDGTARVLGERFQSQYIQVELFDPLNRPITTGFYIDRQKNAYLDMASASGMHLLSREALNPFETTSFGTGQLIRKAIELGAQTIYLGLGGSATVDGGMGALMALGVQFCNHDGLIDHGSGKTLCKVETINPEEARQCLGFIPLILLVDVDNPLLGSRGAARVFGPQKGATPDDVEILEESLTHFAEKIVQTTGIDVSEIAGGGAAGGFAAAFHALLGAQIQPGAQWILQMMNFDHWVMNASCIITGEGKIDRQTLSNKAPYAVLNCGTNFEKPVYVICGEDDLKESSPFCKTFQLIDESIGLKEAIECAYDLVEKRSEELGLYLLQNQLVSK